MNLLGRILMWLVVAAFALYFWPVAILVLLIIAACALMEHGQLGPRNEYGFRPLKKRPIWQAPDGWWYTTDGHPTDPGVLGPFRKREYAVQSNAGQNYMADSEGLFSIPV